MRAAAAFPGHKVWRYPAAGGRGVAGGLFSATSGSPPLGASPQASSEEQFFGRVAASTSTKVRRQRPRSSRSGARVPKPAAVDWGRPVRAGLGRALPGRVREEDPGAHPRRRARGGWTEDIFLL